jgi:hypothetical protein
MSTYEDPYLVVSSDCHAGLPTEQYRPYLESAHHRAFDEFLAQAAHRREEATRLGVRNEAFARRWAAWARNSSKARWWADSR